MFKNLLFATLLLAFAACTNSASNSNAKINSKSLAGTYAVDLTPMFKHLKSDTNSSKLEDFGKGMALLLLNSIDIELSFYDGNKGRIKVEGSPIEIDGKVNGNDLLKDGEFEYKIKNDSLLFIQSTDDDEYKKWAVIKKVGNDYKQLRLELIQEDVKNVIIDLEKIDEN